MADFDPDKPSLVYDQMNDDLFEWQPEWADSYRQYATDIGDGIMNWDGLVLVAWYHLAT